MRANTFATVAMLVLASLSSRAYAAPCAGFDDVDTASVFCVNVEWLRNRQITLGCTDTLYCPNDTVSRLAMAAFLNRLGQVLTPVQVFEDDGMGAMASIGTLYACQTGDVPAAPYPRQVMHVASVTIESVGELYYTLMTVSSANAGSSWSVPFASTTRTGSPEAAYSTGTVVGMYALPANQSRRFAVRVQRTSGATDGFATLRCQVAVSITHSPGTVTPFDSGDLRD